MKKSLLWLLVIVFVVSMSFIGIGCKKEAAPAEEEVVEVAEEVEEVAEEVEEEVEEAVSLSGTITFWHYPPQSDYYMDELWPKFKEMYPNAEIELIVTDWPESHTKLLSSFAAGSGTPDVWMVYGSLHYGYRAEGILYDISEWMEPHKGKFPAPLEDYLSDDEGKIYGVGSSPASGGVMYYRRDVFEASGIDPDSIKTWRDWFEAGKQIYADTNGKVKLACMSPAGVMDWGQERLGMQMMEQRGTDLYDENNNVVFDCQENKEILEFCKEVIDSGITVQEFYWSPGHYSAMENGEIATIPQGLWMEGIIKYYDTENAGKWGVMLMPGWEEGGSRYAETNTGTSWGICSQSKVPELAFKWVEFFAINLENLMGEYEQLGFWPVLLEAYEDPVFTEPDPYFDDQRTGELYIDVCKNAKPLHFGPNWAQATETVVSITTNYINGVISVDDAMTQLTDGLESAK